MNNSIQKMNNNIQNTKIDELSLIILELLSTTPFKVFTVDEIKNKLKINYATVYRKVDSLVKQGVLLKEKYGMASKIQLNRSSERVVSLLSLIEITKSEQFFRKIKGNLAFNLLEIVADITQISDFKSVLIFGSYAKGTHHKNSDLDMLVIYRIPELLFKSLEKEQKEDWYVAEIKKSILGMLKTSELRGGLSINPIIIRDDEHQKMITHKEENVAKETLLNHILLKGYHEYWRDILKSHDNV